MVIRAMNVSLDVAGHRPSQVKVGSFRNSNVVIESPPVGAFDLWTLQFSVITGRCGCIVAV